MAIVHVQSSSQIAHKHLCKVVKLLKFTTQHKTAQQSRNDHSYTLYLPQYKITHFTVFNLQGNTHNLCTIIRQNTYFSDDKLPKKKKLSYSWVNSVTANRMILKSFSIFLVQGCTDFP